MLISRVWRAIKRVYEFLLPIRFSLIALVVLAFAFLESDQGGDILRALAEDRARGTVMRLVLLIIASNLLAYLIWFWSRHLMRFRPDPETESLAAHPGWTRWTPRVLGLFVFLIEIAGFARIGARHTHERTWMLTAALGLLALSAMIYLFIVIKRRAFFDIDEAGMLRPATTWKDFFNATGAVLLSTLVIELALFVWALVNPVSWWILGAGAVLVITIGVWVPLGSFLVAVGQYWRFPILGALLLWAVGISCWTDNHKVRSAGPLPASRPLLTTHFDTWYARMETRYPAGDIPAIIVATEGGGIRAAYWTSTVLTVLQDQIPTFADHCFAISGVSGGALGAAVYNSLLVRRLEGGPVRQTLHADSRSMLDFDALSGTLAAMSQPDLLQRFIPYPFLPDRAAALEKGWEHGWYRAFRDTPQEHLFSRGVLATMQKYPQLPILMLNGTMVETGDRIITSTARIRPFLPFRNAFDAFDQLNYDIPISTAALMSARFTYMSPAGTIPNHHEALDRKTFGHVIDGGYFENSGGVTAGEVVSLILQKRAEGKRVRPFVILIDYYDSTKQKRDDPRPWCPAPGHCGPGSPSTVEQFANEALSPLRGLLATRSARGSQAVGDLVELSPSFVEFRLIPRTVPLPLGWVLSERAQDSIDTAMACEGGNRTGVRLVGETLGVNVKHNWRDPVADLIRVEQAKYLPGGAPPCTSGPELIRVSCAMNGCADVQQLKNLEQ